MWLPLRLIELALVIIGVVLLVWAGRHRATRPAGRSIHSLRWWFPWPKATEFKTRRGYRIEQLGHIALWTFSLLVALDVVITLLGPGTR